MRKALFDLVKLIMYNMGYGINSLCEMIEVLLIGSNLQVFIIHSKGILKCLNLKDLRSAYYIQLIT